MRLKVGAKIALGFGVVLLILFSMGGYSYYKAAELDDLTSDLARANKRADAAVKVQSNYIAAVLAARGYMIYGDENFAKQSDQNFNEALKGFGDILKNTKNPKVQEMVARAEDSLKKYRDGVINQLFPAVKQFHTEKKLP